MLGFSENREGRGWVGLGWVESFSGLGSGRSGRACARLDSRGGCPYAIIGHPLIRLLSAFL